MAGFDETTFQVNKDVMVTAGLQARMKSGGTTSKTNPPNSTALKMILRDISGDELIVSEDIIMLSHLPNKPIRSQKILDRDGLILTYGAINVDDLCCTGWACESVGKDTSIIEIQFFKRTPNNTQILNG